jgi:hypothetical protein
MQNDREIGDFLRDGLSGVGLNERQKHALSNTLAAEMRRGKRSWLLAAADKLRTFWETTYEISLAPAVAVVVVAAAVAGGSLFYPCLRRTEPAAAPRYFAQHLSVGADGGAQIVYIPVD